MAGFLIEPIRYSEIENVAVILKNAFYTNPAYSSVFKDKYQLKEGLGWLFKASLIISNHKSPLTMVVKEKNSQEIIGTFTLIPPQGVKKNISIYKKNRNNKFYFQIRI